MRAVAMSAVVALTAFGSVQAAPSAVSADRDCAGLSATITGTRGDDRLVGTSGDDVIVGARGHDRINGMGGSDVICSGPGSDMVRGGPGADRLLGGPGPDLLQGGSDVDDLRGARGGDGFVPGGGADTGQAGRGSDFALVGPGDEIGLGRGSDFVMVDGAGRVRGGEGHDFLVAFSGTSVFDGGHGIDGVALERVDLPMTLDLPARQATNGQATVLLDYAEGGFGGDRGDTLVGNNRTNYLFGGRGADMVSGNDGDDFLFGEGGPDTVDGGDGDDLCADANDTLLNCEDVGEEMRGSARFATRFDTGMARAAAWLRAAENR